MSTLTVGLDARLLSEATGASTGNVARYAAPLSVCCTYYGINTLDRLSAFLAQVAHESDMFATAREYADGSAYEGRKDLGNEHPGDGKRYRGRGLIQVTGRFNYREVAWALRDKFDAPNFEYYPERLEEPMWAALSAGQYWSSHGCNELADRQDFKAITQAINGGQNGAASREKLWRRARKALSGNVFATVVEPEDADRSGENVDASGENVDASGENVDASGENVDASGDGVDGEQPTNEIWEASSQELEDDQPKEPTTMAPLLAALIPALGSLIPSLGDIYAKNKVSKDNVKAAQIIFDAVVPAVGAANAQDAVERIASAPSELVPVAAKAVEGCWHQFSMMELGSGTEGARKYDLAYAALPWHAFLHSPSFWALLILVPLVYIIVLSLVGVVGNVEWAEAVRSGIAGMVTGTIVGGAVGYYWGQTTSRNRTPPPAGTPPQ